MKSLKYLCLPLSVCLLLGACGGPAAPAPAASEPEAAVAEPVPGYDIPGEEAVAPEPETVQVVTDGLDGSYYNDYLRMTLMLDGVGGCTLAGGSTDAVGHYTADESGALTLDFSTRQETAAIDADGDITIEGRTGRFLRDWDFWGITEAEAAVAAPERAVRTGVTDNGDGTLRFRDLENGLAFTFDASLTLLQSELLAGAGVSDGAGGSVTGRNVTAMYVTTSGGDDEFLEDYVKTFVFPDFEALYGKIEEYGTLQFLHEGIEGRLAAASLSLKTAGTEEPLLVKVILYTSTYPDGTVNYICKTVFAPAERADALAAAVTDMGAVRLKEE